MRKRIELECLYDMFRDRIEENVVYLIYTENECKIDATIDQLMSISACSLTGHHFEPKFIDKNVGKNDNLAGAKPSIMINGSSCSSRNQEQVPIRESKTLRLLNARPTSNGVLKPTSKNNEASGTSDMVESPEHSSEATCLSDDPNLNIDKRIASIQKAIDDLLAEKGMCHEKSSYYATKRMYPVTSYYSELASQYRRMIEQKTQVLVELLLTKSQNANYIDLHGLNPIQARMIVSKILDIRQEKLLIDKQGEASIDIITGWGKHCVTNGQRIKPAVKALLNEKGYDYHRLNKGALRVTIRRR